MVKVFLDEAYVEVQKIGSVGSNAIGQIVFHWTNTVQMIW